MASGVLNKAERETQRVSLSRDVIIDAALRLTLEQPRTSLTLARLGAELGADPTAIYRHFRNRDELMLEVADRVYGQALSAVVGDGDWLATLTSIVLTLRHEMLRRPALSAEVGSRFTTGPNERAGINLLISAFREAGFGEDDAIAHTQAFGAFTMAGIVASAAALIHDDAANETDMRAAADLFGRDVSTSIAEYEDATFTLMLRTQLAGLEALRSGQGRHDRDQQPGGEP